MGTTASSLLGQNHQCWEKRDWYEGEDQRPRTGPDPLRGPLRPVSNLTERGQRPRNCVGVHGGAAVLEVERAQNRFRLGTRPAETAECVPRGGPSRPRGGGPSRGPCRGLAAGDGEADRRHFSRAALERPGGPRLGAHVARAASRPVVRATKTRGSSSPPAACSINGSHRRPRPGTCRATPPRSSSCRWHGSRSPAWPPRPRLPRRAFIVGSARGHLGRPWPGPRSRSIGTGSACATLRACATVRAAFSSSDSTLKPRDRRRGGASSTARPRTGARSGPWTTRGLGPLVEAQVSSRGGRATSAPLQLEVREDDALYGGHVRQHGDDPEGRHHPVREGAEHDEAETIRSGRSRSPTVQRGTRLSARARA